MVGIKENLLTLGRGGKFEELTKLQVSLNLRFSTVSSSAPRTGVDKKNNGFFRMHYRTEPSLNIDA